MAATERNSVSTMPFRVTGMAKKTNKKGNKSARKTIKKNRKNKSRTIVRKTKKKKKIVHKTKSKKMARNPAHSSGSNRMRSKARSAKHSGKMKSRSAKSGDKELAKVEALITLGRERGYITYDEIIREFPTIEDNMILLEEIYERFSVAGIDVLEGGGMLEDTSAQGVLEKKKLQNRRADSGFDSVQMYLREIGQYPLLNGNQEKELAKRILQNDDEA